MFRAVAASALAAGAVVLGLPAAAAQAAGVITVTSAGSPARHAGQLTIGLEATSPIKAGSISATLYAPHSKKAALKVTGFKLTGGSNAGPGVTSWTVKSPITQKELALNTYSIRVRAADTGGDTVDRSGAGTLAFVIHPSVGISVSPATYSYLQTVHISGTDTGLYPSGKRLPQAGRQIEIVPGVTVTTGPAGKYSAVLSAATGAGTALAASSLAVTAVASKTTAGASSGRVHTTIVRDPVTFTDITASPVSYGGTVSISGIAWFMSGANPPLHFAGAHLRAAATGDWGSKPVPAGSGTAQSGVSTAGEFTVHIKDVQLPEQYTVGLAPGELASPWFSQKAQTIAVTPGSLPVADTLSARENVHGTVYFGACVALSNPAGDPVYTAGLTAFPALLINYKVGSSWISLASSTPGSNGCFSPVIAAPGGAGTLYEVTTTADLNYQAGTSQPLQAIQSPKSAIRLFRVNTRKLKAGSRIRLSGLLDVGSRPAGRNARIQIIFLTSGSKTWHVLLPNVRTNSRGQFSASPVMRSSGKIAARYLGTPFGFASRSVAISIRVTPKHKSASAVRQQGAGEFGGHPLMS